MYSFLSFVKSDTIAKFINLTSINKFDHEDSEILLPLMDVDVGFKAKCTLEEATKKANPRELLEFRTQARQFLLHA